MRIVQVSTDLEECTLEYPTWTYYDGTTDVPPPNWDDTLDSLWAMDGYNGSVILSTDNTASG